MPPLFINLALSPSIVVCNSIIHYSCFFNSLLHFDSESAKRSSLALRELVKVEISLIYFYVIFSYYSHFVFNLIISLWYSSSTLLLLVLELMTSTCFFNNYISILSFLFSMITLYFYSSPSLEITICLLTFLSWL